MAITNPLVALGSLNRIRGSVVIVGSPELNVTGPFLGKDGISLALEGNSVDYLPTMTGMVTSPEPYMPATCTIRLLKSQGLAAIYKARMEINALIGDITVTPDASTLPAYLINNCSIASIGDMSFAGNSPDMPIMLRGYYQINASLYTGL